MKNIAENIGKSAIIWDQLIIFMFPRSAIFVSLETTQCEWLMFWSEMWIRWRGSGLRTPLLSFFSTHFLKMTTEDAKSYLAGREIPQLFEVSRAHADYVVYLWRCELSSSGSSPRPIAGEDVVDSKAKGANLGSVDCWQWCWRLARFSPLIYVHFPGFAKWLECKAWVL